MGCFAKGCLTVAIVCVALAVIVSGGGWYLYSKAVENFSSTQPADIRIDPPPSDEQFHAADAILTRLREAMANHQEATIEFTATDLNTLVARHPDFASKRGRIRFGVAESIMTVDLSAPLDSVPLPKLKGRWFNGTARLAFTYAQDQFTFDLKSVEAGGRHLPQTILSSFATSFSTNFSKSFHESLEKDPQTATFWKHVKSVIVQGEKLIVTTQTE